MSRNMFGYDEDVREMAASTTNAHMTDEQVYSETEKYTDREAVAVYRGPNSTIIISELYLVRADGSIDKGGSEDESTG